MDVVAAIENELAFRLVHEARTGAGFDWRKRLGQIEATPLGEHQRLARRHEVYEGEHVVITFMTQALPNSPIWKIFTAHRLPARQGASRIRPRSPPTRTVISPAAARCTPPVTGASNVAMPRAAARPEMRSISV